VGGPARARWQCGDRGRTAGKSPTHASRMRIRLIGDDDCNQISDGRRHDGLVLSNVQSASENQSNTGQGQRDIDRTTHIVNQKTYDGD